MEKWKPVKLEGYERYYVSNLARVRSSYGRILKQYRQITGYWSTNLCGKKQKKKTITIHRLVALAFIPNPHNKPQVNHIDGNPENNVPSNLEWVTSSENIKHGYAIGIISQKGENHSRSKLTYAQVCEIRQKVANGVQKTALAREYGVHRDQIRRIAIGESWYSEPSELIKRPTPRHRQEGLARFKKQSIT